MEELKKDIKLEMHNNYEKFIEKYINKEDYLYTISYAYVMFAKKEPKTFSSLFMTELAGSRTIKEAVNSSWNIDTIVAMEKQYKISKEIAEEVYRDVRFYTHGIATQIACKSVKLKEIEIFEVLFELKKNHTIVIITHKREEAIKCDNIINIKSGRIIEEAKI